LRYAPELLDGEAPHTWGATEALRVWKLLEDAAKRTPGEHTTLAEKGSVGLDAKFARKMLESCRAAATLQGPPTLDARSGQSRIANSQFSIGSSRKRRKLHGAAKPQPIS
jgi:hypothetical protein